MLPGDETPRHWRLVIEWRGGRLLSAGIRRRGPAPELRRLG